MSDRRNLMRVLGTVAGLLIIAALGWTVYNAWDVVTAFDWQPSVGWLVLGGGLVLVSLTLSAFAYNAILGGLHRPAPPVAENSYRLRQLAAQPRRWVCRCFVQQA